MPVDAVPSIGPLPALETLPSSAPSSDGGAFSRELNNNARPAAADKGSDPRTDYGAKKAAAAEKRGSADARHRTEKSNKPTRTEVDSEVSSNAENPENTEQNVDPIAAASDEVDSSDEKNVTTEDEIPQDLLAIDPALVAAVPINLPVAIEDVKVAAPGESVSAIDELKAPANATEAFKNAAATAVQSTDVPTTTDPIANLPVEPVVAVAQDLTANNNGLEAEPALAVQVKDEEPELKPRFVGAKEEDDEDKSKDEPESDLARIRRALQPHVERATQGDLSELVAQMQQQSGDGVDSALSADLAASAQDAIDESMKQSALTDLSKDADEKDEGDPAQATASHDRPLDKLDDVPANLLANHSSSRFHPTLGGHDTPPTTHARPLEVDTARFLQRVSRAFAAAEARGGEEIRLRLSPPELGSLQLEIGVKAGVLTARLETETSAAQQILIENLPQLKERLAEQGMHIESFDVNVSGRNPGGMPDTPQNERDRRDPSWRPPPPEASRPTSPTGPRRSDGTWDGEGLNVIV